ncbi:BolA family protein [Thiolinea disciformis]|uniref:BolA family protein n=1 Tax=Thiolinea disciformis TaxID=125614 RepID=UPI00037F8F12|nr:BolA/IbaG family iron-sulfur metabolism protein [Thiolinea disciformis]
MSMTNEAVAELIRTQFPDAKITVTGDGYKYHAEVISIIFEGVSKVKRHQLVYRTVAEAISSGEVHALTITALTPHEAST